MNPYDTAAVQAVWQRVLRAESAGKPTLAEALAEQITDELTDHVTYLRLARCAGRFAPIMQRIACDEANHAAKLSTLYFLLTGCKSPACPGAVGKPDALCLAVRTRYAEELRGAERYRTMAAENPEHTELFCRLAEEEREHARRLYRIASELPQVKIR